MNTPRGLRVDDFSGGTEFLATGKENAQVTHETHPLSSMLTTGYAKETTAN